MTTTLEHRAPLALRPLPAPATWERGGDRRDRVSRGLSTLFSTRDDLGGVSVVADVLAEDLLWSV
ncbi:MAG: hypothetical protein AVDCRST_MAG36-2742 [uncultured Nocardioidaceae bacterium]|uniref:Uncharacterized protein n=1 Tax=uncultured Nocardioidaceae bacterium TaxID=253824 RepID=A0A6J4MNI3_9ACTN|nr:MAG: hypothetical protein AVDCRST_MAG36-2742 [uncultured Nocardioidaceae bacterium]